jgi:hypothetical protein
MTVKPIVDQKLLLERFPGKGGWTFVRIPDIPKSELGSFGSLKVKGFIDDYEIKQCHLMPLGKGKLMMPVKAEIRKVIGKSEGDWATVVLFSLESPLPLPDDFRLCLEDDPIALQEFEKLSEVEKKTSLEWIYAIKSEEIIVDRMALTISRLAQKNFKNKI